MTQDPLDRRKAEIEKAMIERAESEVYCCKICGERIRGQVFARNGYATLCGLCDDDEMNKASKTPQDARPPQPIPTPQAQCERLPGVEGEAKAVSMAYIGRTQCGCMVGAVVDNPAYLEDIAEDVAEFIRSGLTVSRISVEAVRAEHLGCVHKIEARTAVLLGEMGEKG